MRHFAPAFIPITTAALCGLLTLGCGEGAAEDPSGGSTGDSSSSQTAETDGAADDEGGDGTGGVTTADSSGGTSNSDDEEIEWLDYDATDNPYRDKWQGESEDGCRTDLFTTWPEWECDPGELTGSIVRFWSDDTIPKDDPDYKFDDHETIVNASDGTLEMGIQMLSVDPVVISKVEFHVEFPADLLEFTHIERHWAAIIREEPPCSFVDVEVVEPGLLKFTWWMENLPRVVHKGDIQVASMYFSILASGEGEFNYPRPDNESWDNYSPPNKWHLKSEVTEPRRVWATMVDGTEGPIYWLWNSTLIIR